MKKKYTISGCGFDSTDSIQWQILLKLHKCSGYTEVLSDCKLFTTGLVTSYTLRPCEAEAGGRQRQCSLHLLWLSAVELHIPPHWESSHGEAINIPKEHDKFVCLMGKLFNDALLTHRNFVNVKCNIRIIMKGELSENMEGGRGETSVIHALAWRNLRKS